jgi:hypothetical protein
LRIVLYRWRMVKSASPIEDILSALPAAQDAVRLEIAARIAAGEAIASMDGAEMRERTKALLESRRSDRHPKSSAA